MKDFVRKPLAQEILPFNNRSEIPVSDFVQHHVPTRFHRSVVSSDQVTTTKTLQLPPYMDKLAHFDGLQNRAVLLSFAARKNSFRCCCMPFTGYNTAMCRNLKS